MMLILLSKYYWALNCYHFEALCYVEQWMLFLIECNIKAVNSHCESHGVKLESEAPWSSRLPLILFSNYNLKAILGESSVAVNNLIWTTYWHIGIFLDHIVMCLVMTCYPVHSSSLMLCTTITPKWEGAAWNGVKTEFSTDT